MQERVCKGVFTGAVPAGTIGGMSYDPRAIQREIQDALDRNTWSLMDLARASGVQHPTLSKIRNGDSRPSPETLRKLAPALGKTADYLMEIVGHKQSREQVPTRDELLERFLAMDATEVPFYDVMASGAPSRSFLSDLPIEYGYLPERRRYARGRVKGITVRGNCLAPRVLDGDRVFIDTQADFEDGDIVLAVVGDALHLKRLRAGAGGFVLQPDNGEGSFLVGDDVVILGKYLGLWRPGL
jgi:SOS-response transcriptional repressor LexA